MELIKKNISMNQVKCKSNLQITLDDDINVSDIKPDINMVIKEQGNIIIEDIKQMNGKLSVRGKVEFNLLYLSDENINSINNICGNIQFDEVVNMSDGCIGDEPAIKCSLEDLTTTLINSRKIRVNAILNINLSVEDAKQQEAIVAIETTDKIDHLTGRIEVTSIVENKKDTYRFKDEILIPSSKDNISELLFSDISINAIDIRLLDGKFSIKGEIPVFIVYKSDNDDKPVNYYETVLSFSGIVDCQSCNEEMVEDISYQIVSKDISIREDLDGEDRIIDVEVVLGLSIKIYEMEEIEIINDLYCPNKEVMPIYEEINYENLIMKNNSKHRVNNRLKVQEKQPKILQICHGNGEVKIDDIRLEGEELIVEGIIEMNILYISEDDSRPLNSMKGLLPFSQGVEVKGIKNNSIYDVKASLDQLSIIMLDGDEIEVKAIINLNTIAFDNIIENVITDVEIEDIDKERFKAIPGLVGYIIKSGDTLWSIAKSYYTTIDAIKELNNLEDDELNEGHKIIIMKNTLKVV